MSISATEISELIKKKIDDLNVETEARTEGTVVSLTDGIARMPRKVIIPIQPTHCVSPRLTAQGNRNAASRSKMMKLIATR